MSNDETEKTMKRKKVMAKLKRRQMAYDALMKRLTEAKQLGYTRPGSQNPSRR